jgi:hypothetical protein
VVAGERGKSGVFDAGWGRHVTPKRVLHSNFGCCIGTIEKSAAYKICGAVERRKFLYGNLLKIKAISERKKNRPKPLTCLLAPRRKSHELLCAERSSFSVSSA